MAKQLFEWDYSSYPGAKKYPNLFKPIQIVNLIIPNRIKYATTEDNFNDKNGFITDADVAYMRARAEGIVGGLCFMQGFTWILPVRVKDMWVRLPLGMISISPV